MVGLERARRSFGSGARRRPGSGRWASACWVLAGVLALWGTAPSARAQAPESVSFQVTVLHVTEQGGKVDPKAERFHAILGRKIRYEGLRIVQSKNRKLGINEIGSVSLPTGKKFRFRPLDVGEKGVLVAVDLEKSAQGDFRIPRGKPVIIGGYPYEQGQLMVVLEPRY